MNYCDGSVINGFDKRKINERVHIVGCGSVGANVAQMLVRSGVLAITLWDNNVVEEKDIQTGIYTRKYIGKNRADSLREILGEIDSDTLLSIRVHDEGWENEMISGYIFSCIDDGEINKRFFEMRRRSEGIKGAFAFFVNKRFSEILIYNNYKSNPLWGNSLLEAGMHRDAKDGKCKCELTANSITVPIVLASLAVEAFCRMINNTERPWDIWLNLANSFSIDIKLL